MSINIKALLEHNRETSEAIRRLESNNQALIGQNRELITRQSELQAQLAVQMHLCHQHLTTMQGHLLRLIDEKREWQLEHQAFSRPSSYWKEALAFYQPTRN